MPTYEYKCGNCEHTFELFQSITAKPSKKCPSCGKNKAQRLIGTGAGIIFKGSGFYETDYRSDSYKKAAENEKGKPKSDKGKKEAKSESKTETKTETKSSSESKSDEKKKSA